MAANSNYIPLLVVTMGDPAGIGPEIIIKALSGGDLDNTARLLVVGITSMLRETAFSLNLPVKIHAVTPQTIHRLPRHSPGTMFVLDVETPAGLSLTPGTVSGATGTIAAACIEQSARLCLNQEADALVTAPISKHALHLAGLKETAHTERLQTLSKTDSVEMAFVSDDLRVVLATRHIPLSSITRALTAARVLEALRAAHHLGILLDKQEPAIGLCGVNPHAGEEGMMGNEEETVLIPAIELAHREGLRVSGPLPPDTAFIQTAREEFDVVVALYHDQGLIPFKMLSFGRGAQITLGLPFVRTSVDHGVALDIAGRGVAEPGSLVTAVRLAAACIRR